VSGRRPLLADRLSDQRKAGGSQGARPRHGDHILYNSGTRAPKGRWSRTRRSCGTRVQHRGRHTAIAAPGTCHMLNTRAAVPRGWAQRAVQTRSCCRGPASPRWPAGPTAIWPTSVTPRKGVTHLTTAPPLLQMLVDDPSFRGERSSTVRKMVHRWRRVQPSCCALRSEGLELHPQYGATETGPPALVTRGRPDRGQMKRHLRQEPGITHPGEAGRPDTLADAPPRDRRGGGDL